MPTSPFQRAQQPEEPEGGSVGGRRKRRRIQKTKDRYAHAREDAQLEGLIPTTPEEALKPERVSPSAQTNQPLPELIAQAIRQGWNVDEEMKPHLVQELVDIVMSGDAEFKHKVAAFNALRMADKDQYERDHPETKQDNKPSAINIQIVSVESNQPAPPVLTAGVLPQGVGGGVAVEVVPSGNGR